MTASTASEQAPPRALGFSFAAQPLAPPAAAQKAYHGAQASRASVAPLPLPPPFVLSPWCCAAAGVHEAQHHHECLFV